MVEQEVDGKFPSMVEYNHKCVNEAAEHVHLTLPYVYRSFRRSVACGTMGGLRYDCNDMATLERSPGLEPSPSQGHRHVPLWGNPDFD